MEARQDNDNDDEEDEDEHVNKMNETLKPNTLLQIVRDNHKVKLKQSSVNLNNRYSNSQCNLKITTGDNNDNNNSHNKGQLLKQRSLLKDYGSLGADLISHDGDMENAIIVEGEYSQNKPNKLLSIINNSADCILGDDDGEYMEEDIKDDVVIEASVSRNNVEKCDDNKLNHLTIVDVQQTVKNEEAGKVNPQPSCISTLSNNNAEDCVSRKEATSMKDNLKIIDAKPIRNNCTERALASNTKATGFLKNSTVSVTEASQSHQDVDGTTSCSMPQTTRHQNDDNEITKVDDRIVHRYSDCTRPVTSPSSEKPEWNPNESNRIDQRSGRLDDNNITSSNIDLRVNSMLDKSINRSNKSSLLDHASPFFIRFSSGHINPNDSEQYHRFLTVPRKDHISLSTLRLSRTRQSVNSETPSPTPEFDPHPHHNQHHRNRTLNENIENSCQTQSINCQSERSQPVPRKKRTLYLNKSRTEQCLQSAQSVHIKSSSSSQSNHENILTINRSPYQNCLLFESNAENYRQKLIDNKQKHSQQKSATSTRLAGPTIRSVLETGKSIHHPQQHPQQQQQYAWNSSVTGTCTPNNNISSSSSNSYSHLKENESRIKRTSLSAKMLNEKLRQLKPSTEVSSFEPEISKTSLQQSSKLKRPTSKDSGLITSRSTSQPLQSSQKPPTYHFSNEKSDNNGFQDMNKRQTKKHDYLPLKTTSTLLTSSMSSTNLAENLCIKPNNICSRSIHCQNTLDTSRRRLNSVHILTSELDHKSERNPPVTLTATGSSAAKPSTVSKVNLRTLRSQSADRVLKPRTTCINTPYQTSYQLFQPYLTSTPTRRTKSKRITDILQYSINDSDKTYKLTPFR
ncbi:unnamed protein product [Trichobilharzia szidati]|nr:unnamed protein product [Trichobilharzia szidati]